MPCQKYLEVYFPTVLLSLLSNDLVNFGLERSLIKPFQLLLFNAGGLLREYFFQY
ncbi:hypothetical protein GM3709_3713 (plasmid) [Geminocystis sp. NIES-3709]|nr:hypothetical protein GM3709_3713 [Geminocystis sp. NIES-3709]